MEELRQISFFGGSLASLLLIIKMIIHRLTRNMMERSVEFQVLDLEVRENSLLTVVEKYKDVPSAASFPVDEVQVPGYHCHLARKRILSLSSPQLYDERQSDVAWQS